MSKNFSTLAAVLVPKPKSNKLAPKETNPSGILKTPEATPDKVDLITPISSSSLELTILELKPPKSPNLAINYLLLN